MQDQIDEDQVAHGYPQRGRDAMAHAVCRCDERNTGTGELGRAARPIMARKSDTDPADVMSISSNQEAAPD